jgi:CBS domain-containing protein
MKEDSMKVRDAMTSSVISVQATDSIAQAARTMDDKDVGVLPVLDGEDLVGIVTDRDIAIRAVADPIDLTRPVRDVMTDQVTTCSPEDDVEETLRRMSDQKVRRLPVYDDRDEVVGIFAIADALKKLPELQDVAEALVRICEPDGHHCQATAYA